MARFFPTMRGWSALLFPLIGGFSFLFMLPVRIHETGVGTSIGEPVARQAWLFGAVLFFISVAAIVETLRRGSRADKLLLCIAVPLTFWLVLEFFSLMLLQVRPLRAL